MMTTEAGIEDLTALDEQRYSDLDLNRLSVYAIAWLRDASLPCSFENVVVVLFRCFPTRFSLRGYELPDSNRVNRALLQLGPKWRNWARGSPRTGYALTPLGEETLREVRARLAVDAPQLPRKHGPRSTAATWDPASDLAELRATNAFARFLSKGPTSLNAEDLWDTLKAFPYTPERAIRSRLIVLARSAKDAHDTPAAAFVAALRDLFETRVLKTASPGKHRA